MVADHFHIEPAKVTAVSADFSSSAKTMDGQLTTFATDAENVNDAFGVLAESTEALGKYVQMTQATVTSLRQLQTQLQGYSAGLAATVKAYKDADHDNAQNLAV
ncbi:ESX-1 secretion-associated protein [Kitasatospora sp. RB6PN24]|uniref:type VII secretion target n=1 Tax=Kitasatospora humi TaxID=2893891 RepID=UPI001E29ED8A|nr:type VII secretion target [Kitasatospora humi]MCC9310880.1 ESX-1 secretion-associated protein [Kitasatospora humi]